MKTALSYLATLSLFSLLAVGCTYEGPVIESWEGEADCSKNSNPRLGHWWLNSEPFILGNGEASADEWMIASHFAWRDPTPIENEDPQNMVGGYISMEFEDGDTSLPYIDSEWLENGCPTGQETLCSALGFPSNTTGCSGPGCRDGWLTTPFRSEDGLFVEGAAFHITVRVRDRCGAASNERDTYAKGRYVIGSGPIEITASETADEEETQP